MEGDKAKRAAIRFERSAISSQLLADGGEGQDGQGIVVGHLGQVEKWAVLLGFWGKMAKMAKMAKHF